MSVWKGVQVFGWRKVGVVVAAGGRCMVVVVEVVEVGGGGCGGVAWWCMVVVWCGRMGLDGWVAGHSIPPRTHNKVFKIRAGVGPRPSKECLYCANALVHQNTEHLICSVI